MTLKEVFDCYGCCKQMPGQVMKTMVHVSEKRALVVLMCPACQQKYGGHNPNYINAQLTSAVVALEVNKRRISA